jgi:CheY-like chemotaxis protein
MVAEQAWYEIVFPPLVTLAVIVAAAVLLWLARSQLAALIRDLGIRNVSAFGVDVQFVEDRTEAAYRDKPKLSPPSQEDLAAIRDASQFLAPLAAQSRILWVDDNPGGNSVERSLLLAWEVDVQAARTTEEGIQELRDRGQSFDLVISDWRRPGDSDDAPAGLELLKQMTDLELDQRVIFYHGIVEPDELAERRRRAKEADAVGATGSPGELLRWTLVELARVAIDHPRPVQRARREWLASSAPAARA